MVYPFISYSHKDKTFVEKLEADLKAAGYDVWRDRHNISYGENWDTAIEVILRSGKITHFLFIQSKHSVVSDIARSEINEAYANEIPYIIPLITDDSKTPITIIRRNPIDFRRNYDEAIVKLLDQLRAYTKIDAPKSKLVTTSKLLINKPTDDQLKAAHDKHPKVRLLAAPGTGKSFVIEERVRWLLDNGVDAKSIFVISFTRAASSDLRKRIVDYCIAHGQNSVTQVSVSTLHSMALKALRKSNALQKYPVDPLVLDNWEQEEIFDKEFKAEHGSNFAKTNKGTVIRNRAEQIRRFFEALWSTGEISPAEFMMPEVPISEEEKEDFEKFHNILTGVYACVLPGEIVANCVERIRVGLLEPVETLNIKHLIVDEFQDLNSADVEFIDSVATSTTPTEVYVLGDDDQSVYSFRFAYPMGIQTFTSRHSASNHTLCQCFRCTSAILTTANKLITKYSSPHRVAKSVFSNFKSPDGIVHTLKFRSEQKEADFIAKTCKKLVEQGVNPSEILVLIASRDVQLDALITAFSNYKVDVRLPISEPFIATDSGRYVYALIRVACDSKLQDFLTHRTILGLPKGVGINTCISIKHKVIQHNLKYLELFYYPLPSGIFTTNETKVIERARKVFEVVSKWSDEDTIALRRNEIAAFLMKAFEDGTCEEQWYKFSSRFPDDMTLRELKTYLGTQRDEQAAQVLKDVHERLALPEPEKGFLPPKVQIMTMHGAKGLNATVVFIPGLENDILPGSKRKDYPGLVFEAARMLYVSITRASAACVMTFSKSRGLGNKREYDRQGSDFLTSLGRKFEEADNILKDNRLKDEHIAEMISVIQSIAEQKQVANS